MARDRELDRLTHAVEIARDLRQKAHETKQVAWSQMTQCATELQLLYTEKNAAVHYLDKAKQEDRDVRTRNTPQITAIALEKEAEFARMRDKKAAAKYYTRMANRPKIEQSLDEAYEHECRGKAIANERQGLLAEIRQTRIRREAAHSELQVLKSTIFVKRGRLIKLDAEFENLSAAFTRAREQERETRALHVARREEISAENKQRLRERQLIARRAGVPERHIRRVYIVEDWTNGDTNIYFGGRGHPTGPGHGHYVLDLDGLLTYRRDPGAPHGPQNYLVSQ